VTYKINQKKDAFPEYWVRASAVESSQGLQVGDKVEWFDEDEEVWYPGRITARYEETNETTSEIVARIIIPETAAKGCCYADIFEGGPKQPTTLMSHWWGNRFVDLVKVIASLADSLTYLLPHAYDQAICQHAGGKTDFNPRSYTREELDKTYWLCIFAVNQHVSICKSSWINCNCQNVIYDSTHPLCEMDKFEDVMKLMTRHAVALDANLTTFTRVWVLEEIYTANVRMNLNTDYCGTVSESSMKSPKLRTVEYAQASIQADRDRILEGIRKGPGGVAAFDKVMSNNIGTAIAALRAFGYFEIRHFDKVMHEMRSFPACANRCSSSGLGGTLLMMAAAFGDVWLVKEIVAFAQSDTGCIIDLNITTPQRWSALHYAAVCFNPNAQLEVVTVLLDAKCDPNITNVFGKTALEEFVINACVDSSVEAFELLFENTVNSHMKIQCFFKSSEFYEGIQVFSSVDEDRITYPFTYASRYDDSELRKVGDYSLRIRETPTAIRISFSMLYTGTQEVTLPS